MKKRFLLACLFAMSITGTLQASSTPAVSRTYGDQFVTEVSPTQIAGTIGTLNNTFALSGSLNLATTSASFNQYQGKTIQILPDGTFLIGLSLNNGGAFAFVAKYTAQGDLDSNYASGGTGFIQLNTFSSTSLQASLVDTQGRLLVTSGNSSSISANQALIIRIDPAGVSTTSFNTSGQNWNFIGGLGEQTTGEIIAAGFTANGVSTLNAQIARYTLGGQSDTSFGTSGIVLLNGSNNLPNVTTPLYNVVIDANNNIYIAFIAATTVNGFTANSAYLARFTAAGAFDTTWGSSGIVALPVLNSATSGLYLAQDVHGNFIVAGQVSPNVIVTGVNSTGGSIGGFTNFNTSTINSNTYSINNIITTSNNKIFISGSNLTTKQMSVIRLTGSGVLDTTTFNAPLGYNFFSITGGTITASQIQSVGIAPDGQLFTTGYQISSGLVFPYVSNLYNEQYVSQIAQSPATQEQGNRDVSFGNVGTEVYPGVVSPFNGLYGPSLLQQPQAAIEITTGSNPAQGDILIGMSGKTNSSSNSSMMFSWLTSAGVLDTAAGNSGYLTLQNLYANEYLASMVQGQSGVVYVAGSAVDTGSVDYAILRAYGAPFTSSTATWSAAQQGTGYKGIGVGLQGFVSSQRILLFVSETATSTGHISRYLNNGSLDTTFGNAGYVYHNAFAGINMGPCYGTLVDNFDDIYVAFVDATSHQVTIAAISSSGTSLLTSSFGVPHGYVTGLFGGTTTVNSNNIRTCFDNDGNIIVAVVDSATPTQLQFVSLNAATGALNPNFNGGSPLSISINGATSLNLEQITGVSDGTVLATFWDAAADDTMIVTRIIATGVSAGSLDTTFNSQGSQPGVLPIKIGDKVADYNARVVNAALVQSTAGASQGNIVIAGYESVTSNDSTPMVMSVYGDPGSTEIPYYPVGTIHSPGTFDTAYDLDSLFGTVGSGTSIFVYPSGNTYQSMLLIGIDSGTTSEIIRMNLSTQTLDLSFGTNGTYTINQGGVSSVSIDAKNNILVGGTTSGGVVWAQQLTPTATGATPAVSFTMPTNLTKIHNIYQQESGRYIIAASGTQNNPVSATNIGILVAFQDKLVSPATTLQVDPTFNPQGTGAVTAGQCSVGATTGLYAVAINNNAAHNPDTIAVAYVVSGTVNLGVFTADGSGYSSLTFNTGGGGAPIATNISADSSAVVQLNIDPLGNMVVAASYNNGATHQVQVQRYSPAGIKDTTFNGNTGINTISNLGTAGVTLTDILETTVEQTILIGYNTAGGNGPLFAARLDSTGILDLAWNPVPTSPDIPGILTYSADPNGQPATQMNSAAIALDGTILSIGSTAAGTSGDPILTLVYGSGVIQTAQDPLESPAGTLDLTIPNGNSGALPLATLPAGGSVSGVPQRLYIYNSTINSSANGAMLIASTSGATLYVTQLNADLSLNSNFGSGSGSLTLTPNAAGSPTSITVTDMYVANGTNDTTQPIYIAGYTTKSGVNTPFGVQITSNGSSGTFVSPASAFAGATGVTGSIRQSTNSRILVSGFNGTNGAIVAYNSTLNAIDTSFGNNIDTISEGYYTTSVSNPIYAMTTDNSDRIYIAYQTSSTTILVQRLLENGTALDTTFGTAGTFTMTGTNLSIMQIHMAIDLTNNQLVIAAQSGTGTGNILQVNRYNFATNAATGSVSSITISGAALNLSDLFIDNNQNIYVVGYINSGAGVNNSVVARVKSTSSTTIALDTTYAATSSPAGVANLSAGAMTTVTAAALDPDRRVYLVGSNGSTTAYMGRFFGDYYWTEIYPAILQGQVGTIDLTLYPNFTGGIVLSSQTGWSSLANYTAQAIIENPNGDGTSYIAFGNGTNLIVGQVNADMIPLAGSFGSANGLTTAVNMATVNSIALDAFGNIIVAGINAGVQKVVSFTSAGILNATFAAPTLASTIGTTVAQQKSGRYIVGGYDGSANGLISAYKNESAISASSLPVDLTFGPAANNGYYPTGINAPIDDLCIDSNDEIYFVYRSSGTVFLGKLTANGSGLADSQNSPYPFNAGAVYNTGIAATQPARIAINSAGNILVGASTGSGPQTIFYNATSHTFLVISISGISTNIVTKLVGFGTEFYGVMYNPSLTNATVFAVTSTGHIDTSFGASGLLTTIVQSPTIMNGLSVQFDGKVVMVGRNASNPILLRGYGYPYVAQYAQAPDQIAAGILDTTLWPTTGAFALNNTTNSTFNSAVTGSTVKRVYESGNGVMLFVADNGSTTTVFRLLKDLTLDTSFNGAGYRQFTTVFGGTTGLFVDSTNNIFITGNNGTSWTIGMTSAGANLSPSFNPTVSLATANQILEQSTNRIILAGQGSVATGQANTHGYLLGYTNTGALDQAFGTGGQVDMGGTNPITDISIDANDNIIAVSNNFGAVVLQRVSASGEIITMLNGGTAITGAIGGIKVVHDANGYIIVAAATATGYVIRSYNNDANGTNYGGLVTITAGTTPVLANIYATSDSEITLIGYDSTTGNAIVARLVSGSTLVLDSTFNAVSSTNPGGTPGYIVTSVGLMNQFFDGIIHADDRIMLVGSHSSAANPYMGRIFGDNYVTYVSQGGTVGVPGTINPTFGTNGAFNLSTLAGITGNSKGKAILGLSNGDSYIALQNASNTQLARILSSGQLDLTYGGGTGIATSTALLGIDSMLQDSKGNIVLVGSTGGAGWVKRYTPAGIADASFGSGGQISSGTMATMAIEQTLARLVVAGANASGNGALFAYTSIDPLTVTTGAVDTTFGNGTGTFSTGVANPIYTLIADQYDRLIFASLNAANNAVDLYRLTPTGELDITFGINGKVINAIANANSASQIFVALNLTGNIVLAASTTTGIAIKSFNNGTSIAIGGNGAVVNAQYTISTSIFSNPTLTGLVNTSDGYTLVLGNQTAGTSSASPSWIARLILNGSSAITLDSTGFNPAANNGAGMPGLGVAGIFEYYNSTLGITSPFNVYNAFTVNSNGTLGVLGYEVNGGTNIPMLLNVYDSPYITEESQSPDAQPVGTNDRTFGVSPTFATDLGVIFYGGTGDTTSGQVAQTIVLYDDNNFVVAVNGNGTTGAGSSKIMINMLDTDGLGNPTFNPSNISNPSSAVVLSLYDSQVVNDMITFTTLQGVHKAIIAGYATNPILSSTNSIVMQYILTPGSQGIDTSFGGYDGNPAGIAFGDGQAANAIGLQTSGRIIVGGLSQNNLGLLLGYTPEGNLDISFGNDGYQSANTGTTGIYTHGIDSENRIAIAYNNGGFVEVVRFLADGSAPDSSFTASTLISGVTSNSNMKLVVDSNNNVDVAAIINSGNTIAINSYNAANGTLVTSGTFNGSVLGGSGSSNYTIGALLIDAQDNIIIVATDNSVPNILVARMVASFGSYILDTTFNHTGYLVYAVAAGSGNQATTDAMIHPDGRIIIVGSEQ